VRQAANERNYHAFYMLLRGASDEDREALDLRQGPEGFR
jgi:myosin heavy subunit